MVVADEAAVLASTMALWWPSLRLAESMKGCITEVELMALVVGGSLDGHTNNNNNNNWHCSRQASETSSSRAVGFVSTPGIGLQFRTVGYGFDALGGDREGRKKPNVTERARRL